MPSLTAFIARLLRAKPRAADSAQDRRLIDRALRTRLPAHLRKDVGGEG